MRIKLISPRMSLRPMDSEFKRAMSPSLALLVIAGLTPREHDVTIADENVHAIDLNDHPDLVGITVNVDTSRRAYVLADAYRARHIPVILGGIHASACPDEALQHADAVCVGEAEEVWQGVLEAAGQGRLRGIYYHPRPADLGKTPLPRWDLLNPRKYLYTNVVCATRGCPFACSFCYNSADYVHHAYRTRPIEHVLAEIQQLPTRHVMFVDDNLIGDVAWTRELVRAITPWGLRWNAAVSANVGLYPDLLDEMARSGCRSLFIGLETINGDAVRGARKHQNHVAQYEKLIAEVHRRGIMVNASMVWGFDEEGPDAFEKTLHWLVRNRVETMTGHILTPYPGTKLHQQMESAGRIVDHDWRHYNTAHVVFAPRRVSAEELQRGYLWMYRSFYSLENIARRMPAHPAQRVPFLLFNLGYRKFGKVTSMLGRAGLMQWIGRSARRLAYGVA